MPLHFKTLGVPELFARTDEHDAHEKPLRLRYRKSFAVLGYLTVENNRWHPRRHLAHLFWPHLLPEAGLANLRLILKDLGDVLTNESDLPCLNIERQRLGLFLNPSFNADVLFLEEDNLRSLRHYESHEASYKLTTHWQPRLDNIDGEFLSGIDVDEYDDFADWLLIKRAFFERTRNTFFHECVATARRCNVFDTALKIATTWAHCCPTSNEAARSRMELLALVNRPSAALDTYADLAIRLEQLEDGAPNPDTEALRQRIAATISEAPRANAATLPDEVRRVVVLYIELDLNEEYDEDKSLEPDQHRTPLDSIFDEILARWNGQRFPTTGLALGAIFGLVGDGEQAPRRALSAALEIADAPAFALTRIGICEGKALISPSNSQPPLTGSALPTLAQRLALCGDPGDVIVTEPLTNELRPRTTFKPLSTRRFTGLPGEHTPCRLIASRCAKSCDVVDPFRPTPSTPFIGRWKEQTLLSSAINKAVTQKRTVFIEVSGEPGAGKSRLLSEFAQEHRTATGEVYWFAHRPELQHVSLGALRETLHRRIIPSHDMTDCKEAEADISGSDERVLSSLRSFLTRERLDTVDFSGHNLIESLITLLFRPTRTNQPSLLVFEDMHWADETTQQLLNIALQNPPPTPALVVLTCRPNEKITPPKSVTLPVIALQPLTQTDTLALISAIDHDGRINASQQAKLAKMSGGLPFCAEYVARIARDQPVSDASLFGVLQSVLDRMGPDKLILQAASIFGSTFCDAAVQALLPEHDLSTALQQAELLAICTPAGANTYAFRHALLRDCAYESIPPKQRRDWHYRAALWLTQQTDRTPADIAHHFEAAHAWRKARDSWWEAAEAAYLDEFARDAKDAAMRALSIANKDKEPFTETDKAEIELLAGYATLMADGYGAKEAQRFFATTSEQNTITSNLSAEIQIRALTGMAAAIPQGRKETQAIMNRLDKMTSRPAHRMMVCYGYGSLMFWRGEFAESLRHLDEAIEIGKTIPSREWLRYSADNPVTVCRALKGTNLAFSKTPEEAMTAAAQAIADARHDGRAHGLCLALTTAAGMYLALDQVHEVEQLSSEALDLATRWNFPLWRGYNTMFGLWTKARLGKLQIGTSFKLISMHREFTAASRISPVTAWWFAAHIFEALEHWSVLDTIAGRALTLANNGGDRYCMPDLMRQKSLAKLERGDKQGAHHWLEQAKTLTETINSAGFRPRLDQLENRIKTQSGT